MKVPGSIPGRGQTLEPLPYDRFRTGLTYRDVYGMLFDRKYKRRHTVLGKWHQIKLEMYDEYLRRLDEVALSELRR